MSVPGAPFEGKLARARARAVEQVLRAAAAIDPTDDLTEDLVARVAARFQVVEEEDGHVLWVCTRSEVAGQSAVVAGVRIAVTTDPEGITVDSRPVLPSSGDRDRLSERLEALRILERNEQAEQRSIREFLGTTPVTLY